MPRIVVDKHTCEGSACARRWPSTTSRSRPTEPSRSSTSVRAADRVEEVRAAVESCPVMALTLVEA